MVSAFIVLGGVYALETCLMHADPNLVVFTTSPARHPTHMVDFILIQGVMALGYIAVFSERLAMAVIVSQGIVPLANALSMEQDSHIKAAAAWALGQVGQHTPEHASYVAEANVFPALLRAHLDPESSEDLQTKAKRALKNVLQKCVNLPALEALLADAPPNVLKYVVSQFAKVLPNNAKARRLFVTSGGLKKILEIKAEAGSQLQESIQAINACYPEEMVKYYSPGYSEALLARIDDYQPIPV